MPQIDQEYSVWRNDLNGYRSEQRADIRVVVKRRIVQMSEVSVPCTVGMKNLKGVAGDRMEAIERADDEISAQACVASNLHVIVILPVKATDPEREVPLGPWV